MTGVRVRGRPELGVLCAAGGPLRLRALRPELCGQGDQQQSRDCQG